MNRITRNKGEGLNNLKAAQIYGQSIWLDYIRRDLITTGKLKGLVTQGLCGLTSNPTIFEKAIASSKDYDNTIRNIVGEKPGIDTESLYEHLVIEDIQMAADILRPVYDKTDGLDGLASLEASPYLAYDTQGTIDEVRRLWRLVNRPNAMIKVPSTQQGIDAIELLIAEGININVTLMFSLKHYEAVSRAYVRGVERSPKPDKIASVASFFVSRVDTYVDRELERIGTEKALALRGKAAIANSKLVYRRFRQIFLGKEFDTQRKRSARVQRILWGSTSTKNPAYSDLLYVEELIGPYTVNTVPMETLEAFLDHGNVHSKLETGTKSAERILTSLAGLGVNIDVITEQLQQDGVKAFADSFSKLLSSLKKKHKKELEK